MLFVIRPVQQSCIEVVRILIILLLCASRATAQDAPGTDSTASVNYGRLVAKLGHPSFEVREEAAARLQRVGLPARPALLKALKSEDLETRMGAHRVLVYIMQADFDAQLRAFIQGKEIEGLNLPGWRLFANLAGDTPESRRLFAQMIRDEPELLEKLEEIPANADALGKLLEQRVLLLARVSHVDRSRHLTVPCVATLLLISQQPEVRSVRAESRLHTFLTDPSVKQAIVAGTHFSVLQKILTKWVSSGNSEHYALRIALAYGLRTSGTELARRILTADAPNGSAIAYSAMVLVRFGESNDLPLLLPHLSNTQVFHSWHNMQLKKEPIRIQVRDAVLAMAIRLTDQDPPDYGFKLLRADQDTVYKVYTLGFLEDSDRETAFQKWQAWTEAHPDRISP
jgi:hypothetical protein